MTDLLDLIESGYSTGNQAAILALIAGDPSHARERTAIIDAIQQAVRADGLVSGDEWRPLIPSWVSPKLVGVTVNALSRKGVIVFHSWDDSHDFAGRNGGKKCRRYRWVGAR